MMTAQQIFDKVVAHLRAQGCKSMNARRSSCVYRGPEGRKCAAGALIADEHYTPNLDASPANTVGTRDVDAALVKSGVPDDALYLVRDLQVVHDAYPVEYWEERFRQIADGRDLEYTAP